MVVISCRMIAMVPGVYHSMTARFLSESRRALSFWKARTRLSLSRSCRMRSRVTFMASSSIPVMLKDGNWSGAACCSGFSVGISPSFFFVSVCGT